MKHPKVHGANTPNLVIREISRTIRKRRPDFAPKKWGFSEKTFASKKKSPKWRSHVDQGDLFKRRRKSECGAE